MAKKPEPNIFKTDLFDKEQHLLLAMSGGIDSVVLAHLLHEGGFRFSIAHCNFKLRGMDSDGDEEFCETLAKQLGAKFFVKRFHLNRFAREHKLSLQTAARQLRYNWFSELMAKEGMDFLVTAHHASDTVETVLINLLRGTGIKGLKGIPEKNGRILRPLLQLTKDDIRRYAAKKNITFRIDKSNTEDKYDRNFLRLNVIPKLRSLNANLERTFIENGRRFAQEDAIVTDYLQRRADVLKKEQAGNIIIDKAKLKKEKYAESLLHFLLSPYGFNATQQQNILTNISSNAVIGKLFSAPGYKLTIARTELVIQPDKENSFEPLTIGSLKELKRQSLFKAKKLEKFSRPARNEIVLSAASLVFPLTIRGRQTGDKFMPFGMKGFKLVSDLLKEEKLNAFEKENCRLLVNGNGEIIWVAGHRSDDRYKVTEADTDLLKLELVGN